MTTIQYSVWYKSNFNNETREKNTLTRKPK